MVVLGLLAESSDRFLDSACAQVRVRVRIRGRVRELLPKYRLIQRGSHHGNCQGISAATEWNPQQQCYINDARTLAAYNPTMLGRWRLITHPHIQSPPPFRVTDSDWLVVGLPLLSY